jgi:hypothetical protein
MKQVERPSPQDIRKAFGEHLTVSVDGYEQTVWDILNWLGIEEVCLFLEDQMHDQENVGVSSDYVHMSIRNLEDSIKEKANETLHR